MFISTMEQLEAIYDAPVPRMAKMAAGASLAPPFIQLIENSSFFVLASVGPEGLDCSARGDPPGFVRVQDEKTILFPDRPGNNKIESLRNIVRDPRVSLLFLVPGCTSILRVNGTARISVDDELLCSFSISGAPPKSVVTVHVEIAYMQCARALMRSRLWEPSSFVDAAMLPSMGDILAYFSSGSDGGKTFDDQAEARMRASLW